MLPSKSVHSNRVSILGVGTSNMFVKVSSYHGEIRGIRPLIERPFPIWPVAYRHSCEVGS
jgi:hypothetical protein